GGQMSSEQFRVAIGSFYTRFARSMNVPEEWARANIEQFVDIVRYRLGLERLRSYRNAWAQIDYAGTPQAFEQVIPVFDEIVRAQAEGRYGQYRYEDSGFHQELST